MREEHVEISGRKLHFHFRGKSGQVHDIELTDQKLAKIVHQIQCIPGEELFHYINDDGEVARIYSEDVNAYLGEISGQEFTAKDFRTWVGSGQAALELETAGPAETETEAKKNVIAAVKNVAKKLGNKPSTCRKYYIHPAVLSAYSDRSLFEAMKVEVKSTSPYALQRHELAVLKIVADHSTEHFPVAA
jgi:DNA topoisomerase-1